MMKTAYIYDAVRTPRGRGHAEKGALRDQRPIDLLKVCLDGLQKRHDLDTGLVEEVALGCNTVSGEQGANLAKIAALYAGWDHRSNGVTVSSFCTSGLEAVQMSTMKVMTGSVSAAVAGGVESMSRVPMFSDGGSWFSDREVARATGFIHMGLSAELIANIEGFSAKELNQYAVHSHERAAAAWDAGIFTRSVLPVGDLLLQDELFRRGLTMEKMEALPKVFQEERDRRTADWLAGKMQLPGPLEFRHTVGTAPGIADAAALLLIGDEQFGKNAELVPLAKLTGFASVSVDPLIMLTGVVDATRKLLEQQALSMEDIDLFEVNESFAAVPLKFMKAFGLTAERVNINGGAIALGHPLGATGAVLLQTLIDNLRSTGGKRGLATICGGAGIAQATLLELV